MHKEDDVVKILICLIILHSLYCYREKVLMVIVILISPVLTSPMFKCTSICNIFIISAIALFCNAYSVLYIDFHV